MHSHGRCIKAVYAREKERSIHFRGAVLPRATATQIIKVVRRFNQ